jgi:hypothetical protein
MTRDILVGVVKWRGFGVIRPVSQGRKASPIAQLPKSWRRTFNAMARQPRPGMSQRSRRTGSVRLIAFICKWCTCCSRQFLTSRAKRISSMNRESSIRITTCITYWRPPGISAPSRRSCCQTFHGFLSASIRLRCAADICDSKRA